MVKLSVMMTVMKGIIIMVCGLMMMPPPIVGAPVKNVEMLDLLTGHVIIVVKQRANISLSHKQPT
jgi:hypothetical protein